MDEIVEFACDICGQKHRFPASRMGRDVDCRTCGAPFPLAKHTIAQSDDEDEEPFDTFGFFRSTCVVGLLILVIGGLAWLPFHHPGQKGRAVAAVPPSPGGASPSASNAQAGGATWPPASRAAPSRPPASGAANSDGGRPGAKQPAGAPPPLQTVANTPSSAESEDPRLAGVPNITSIEYEGKTLCIRGSGFKDATQIVPFYVPRQPRTKPTIGSNTDREIRVNGWSSHPLVRTGAFVANVRGAAVTIPDDAQRIGNGEPDLAEIVHNRMVVVGDGGVSTLKSTSIAVVDGGELQVQPGLGFYFLARGKLHLEKPVDFIVFSRGAKIELKQRSAGSYVQLSVPILRLCKVRSLAQ